jgi:hypothetical protein
LNGIRDPSLISIGQEIHLFPGRSQMANPAVEARPIEILLKEQPKLVKYPYSVAAMAQIDKVQEQKKFDATLGSPAPTVAKSESPPKPEIKPASQADTATDISAADDAEEPALDNFPNRPIARASISPASSGNRLWPARPARWCTAAAGCVVMAS